MLLRTSYGHLHFDFVEFPDRPVVCFLHSLTSDSGMWLEQVAPLVEARYSVLRLDMRGHGGSSPAPGLYRIEELASEVISVLDHLGIRRVHLVGLSIGGMIAQALAADRTDRVISLVACATTAEWTGDTEMMQARLKKVAESGSLEAIVDSAMEQRYSPAMRATRPERWNALRETFLSTSMPGYVGAMHAVLNHDVSARLGRIRCPLLVVSGSDDPVTPASVGRDIAHRVAGARYEEIAGGRHFLTLEYHAQFNPMLLDWLAAKV